MDFLGKCFPHSPSIHNNPDFINQLVCVRQEASTTRIFLGIYEDNEDFWRPSIDHKNHGESKKTLYS